MRRDTRPKLADWIRCRRTLAAAAFVSVAVASVVAERGAAEPAESDLPPLPDSVSFNDDIRPIFASRCVKCHGGVKQAGGLSLIYRDQVLAGGDSTLPAITPGEPVESYLLDRISDSEPDSRMPPAETGPPLDARQIELVDRWIRQGAKWEEAWAFVPPHKSPTPAVVKADWPRGPLDQFALAKMEAASLAPAAPARDEVWLRRVFLDLTGLPPSPADYQAFTEDHTADARARAVDELLASPRFGERWASTWLDLARYADTVGFEKDPRRDIWPYRDWVIRALNADMPFDQFTIKQLAGDLLPKPTLGDRVATAFHRNTQTNTEGGVDDEEYRTAAVIDRANTTWQAWQGITFGCAQCHSHPYEPIENEEFYRFVAFFNNTQDQDVTEDYPVLAIPADTDQWRQAQQLDLRIAELRQELFDQRWKVAGDDALWKPLTPTAVSATGQTKLIIVRDDTDAVDEVRTQGTVSAYGTFTIDLLPPGLSQMTAVRIEALPVNLAKASKIPENGFVVSQITAEVVSGGKATPVEIASAFSDEPAPILDPDDSLRDNDLGWGAYSRMSRRHAAVFVFAKPVELKPDDRLRLALRFSRTDSGEGALVIQRGRYSATESRKLTELATSDESAKLREKLAALRRERAQINSTPVPIIEELASPSTRSTYTFVRGNWMARDAEVTPGVPKIMPPLHGSGRASRLDLARWLVSQENPLTARVMVNRLWAELFGVGLVETAEDFGTSGARPSNQALLDDLALRFQGEYAWSIKRLLREIVLSATYGQDGSATPTQIEADPRNRLLSRGPRTRLTAEMVRDQALALSGRLSTKMYGAPVMPPQPPGVWRSVYNDEVWKTSPGEDQFRRAIYTYVKRTSGYPSLLTFDMPSRDVCTARRIATNTPLQALATLNDEAYVELAKALAERMAGAGPTPAEQIASGYYLATGRVPPVERLARLQKLYDEAIGEFDADPDGARDLASTRGRFGLTIVANTLLNLDELLTK